MKNTNPGQVSDLIAVGGYQPTDAPDKPKAPKGGTGLIMRRQGYTPTKGIDSPIPPDTKGMGVEDPTQDINSGITTRYNKGKIMYQLVPWEWLEVLAKIFTMGAMKYAPNNWKLSLNTNDHDDAVEERLGSAWRHLIARLKGEVLDPESGEPHLGHTAWNILFVMWYDMYEKKDNLDKPA